MAYGLKENGGRKPVLTLNAAYCIGLCSYNYTRKSQDAHRAVYREPWVRWAPPVGQRRSFLYDPILWTQQGPIKGENLTQQTTILLVIMQLKEVFKNGFSCSTETTLKSHFKK